MQGSQPGMAADQPGATPGRLTPDLEEAVAWARADAARRTGLEAAGLRLVLAGHRTWSDASLGCPEPGRVYAQVLTDGVRVVLDTGTDLLDYRGRSGGRLRLCRPGGPPPVPPAPPGATRPEGLVDPRPSQRPRP